MKFYKMKLELIIMNYQGKNISKGHNTQYSKSGEVLNWNGFSPFQLHLSMIVNRSQSASCQIANVMGNADPEIICTPK